jgi:hypothetical protein
LAPCNSTCWTTLVVVVVVEACRRFNRMKKDQ